MNAFAVMLISILLALLVVICITVISHVDKPNEEPEVTEEYFKIVKQFPGYDIVYHLTTKVMYIHSSETHSFTQLVNTDGSPMIWKE